MFKLPTATEISKAIADGKKSQDQTKRKLFFEFLERELLNHSTKATSIGVDHVNILWPSQLSEAECKELSTSLGLRVQCIQNTGFNGYVLIFWMEPFSRSPVKSEDEILVRLFENLQDKLEAWESVISEKWAKPILTSLRSGEKTTEFKEEPPAWLARVFEGFKYTTIKDVGLPNTWVVSVEEK